MRRLGAFTRWSLCVPARDGEETGLGSIAAGKQGKLMVFALLLAFAAPAQLSANADGSVTLTAAVRSDLPMPQLLQPRAARRAGRARSRAEAAAAAERAFQEAMDEVRQAQRGRR